MVNLLFIHDDKLLATAGTVRKLLDPACGTGGMLAEAQRYLREHNTEAKLYAYGQDYNKRAFATAASDMLMKEVSHNGGGDNVRFGDIFTEDQFPSETFDYFLSNPPFGVDWKKQQKEIQKEHEKRGFDGRFGAGLPRVNDGALLFLQHMWSKREDVKPKEHKEGSRLAIVFSGSPMFTGGAGSGESESRRWLLENDWFEAIVALPESMFYNTGIGTYVWVVTNCKEKRRKGKVIAQIDEIVRLYGKFEEGPRSKIFDNADFGYTRVTIERPLRLTVKKAGARISLRTSFPNIQFIATTHSPFIIQSLRPGELITLDPEEFGEYANRSVEDIAEHVMGVEVPQKSERYLEMMKTAEEYYRLLQDAPDQAQEAEERLAELAVRFSDDPAYQAQLKLERAARTGDDDATG